ncbi:hypothetical protein QYH69_11490 [Paraburkholderia sp. SARCC-3016]|uniref:hypothetical protein n=1 Tax=Paraburkholderia sp. SARCC-3016 TaxID=3058611 RepID=UPI00280932E1|nr:hypothetical protein [Paraburkholderia sp. SARCC-3016]MDQ7977862.1 hypothetical protein [Paraburkholderia sp. SARCC-3016]
MNFLKNDELQPRRELTSAMRAAIERAATWLYEVAVIVAASMLSDKRWSLEETIVLNGFMFNLLHGISGRLQVSRRAVRVAT